MIEKGYFPMSTKRSTDMAFQIEMYDRYGRWLNDWAGDPSDNVFATEAEAEAMLTELLRIFDAPADEDEYIPEYRLVEVAGDGDLPDHIRMTQEGCR